MILVKISILSFLIAGTVIIILMASAAGVIGLALFVYYVVPALIAAHIVLLLLLVILARLFRANIALAYMAAYPLCIAAAVGLMIIRSGVSVEHWMEVNSSHWGSLALIYLPFVSSGVIVGHKVVTRRGWIWK